MHSQANVVATSSHILFYHVPLVVSFQYKRQIRMTMIRLGEVETGLRPSYFT